MTTEGARGRYTQSMASRPVSAKQEFGRSKLARDRFDNTTPMEMQRLLSSIELNKITERPISAATYQKRKQYGERHQHLQYELQSHAVASEKRIEGITRNPQRYLSQEEMNFMEHGMPAKTHHLAKSAKPLTFQDLERMEVLKLGLNFMPDTNMNSDQAMARTVGTYISNAHGRKRVGSAKPIQPDRNYIKTNSGKTGVVSIPNKSQRILESAGQVKSKILSKTKPLDLETKPLAGLVGYIQN